MFNTKSIKFTDPAYPTLLKQINNPPKTLYYKGKWDSQIFANCIAVVGSRRMTEYGRKVCEQLVFELSSAGLTVVSGFMFGIDITAHRSALLSGGRTIAVMPCSADTVIPAYEKALHDQIQETGLVISEYADTTAPKHWTFVKRNRLIAGLCQAVLVVEAAKDSGSLITADFAIKYHRKLFAVPGNINSKTSEGTLALISKGKAVLTTNSKTILSTYAHLNVDPTEQSLLNLLSVGPCTVDDLCVRLDISYTKVIKVLGSLLRKGTIIEKIGKYELC